MFWEIIFMALVGGVIGWFTNYLAIKLIFRPLYPIKIPLIGIKLQGLVPKRREEIATSIGKTVEEQLLSLDDIMGYLNTDENQDIIIKNIRIGILKIISEKIPAFIPHGIKNTILKYTGDIVEKESKDYIEKNMDNLISQAIKKIGRILLNYIKLFLIPFVFVFMILALLVKGIKVLAKKIILNRE